MGEYITLVSVLLYLYLLFKNDCMNYFQDNVYTKTTCNYDRLPTINS